MLDQGELNRGTHLFVEHLERIIDENPEISDIHNAFEYFCMNKYSIGDPTECKRTGGKGDCGIDFYSSNGATYHIAQCKIPAQDWLEAHPEKTKSFGSQAVSDCRDALRFLLGDSRLSANDEVRYLYGQVQTDRSKEDFSIVFFLLVFGRLNERADSDFKELVREYGSQNVRLVLQQIDDIVDDFIVGSRNSGDRIEVKLRKFKGDSLNANDYCYFLANAADIFKAFQDYGWRLFDLNLRYEIRNSTVNGEIVNSLKTRQGRKNFHHYNNGLVIVCQHYAIRDTDIRITNAQVINGLQTVKSIYNAITTKEVDLSELETECRVQVKVIRNEKPAFVADVVQATNNQNPMSPRSLKSNSREQKTLRREFSMIDPKWFLQVKQGEWDSLTQEGGRFFKTVVGFPPAEFKPEPNRKRGRVIDNQDAAKAWLAAIGYSDWAGDRTTHYFANNEVYDCAFRRSPSEDHWKQFAKLTDFRDKRSRHLEVRQATAYQYLLAYFLWELVRNYIPSPTRYREEALMEGVRQGKITKAGGSITSTINDQEQFLADNHTYQTWRLMSNMKELLVESAMFVLANRYGVIDEVVSRQLLSCFDARDFLSTGDAKSVALSAVSSSDMKREEVFSRTMGFLKHATGQFWEDKRAQILSTSRLRILLLRRDMIADFKNKLLELNMRVNLDRPWNKKGSPSSIHCLIFSLCNEPPTRRCSRRITLAHRSSAEEAKVN